MLHKKQVMAAQLQSKAEEEDIRKLEFQAQQRMQALEQAALHEASLAKLRDEVRVRAWGPLYLLPRTPYHHGPQSPGSRSVRSVACVVCPPQRSTTSLQQHSLE